VAGTNAHGPLDPLTLAKDVTTLVSAGLVAQARALAVARQQDAAAYVSDVALAIRTRNSQEEFRTDVAYYLNRLLPDVIATLSSTAGAAALVAALETSAAGVTDEQALAGLVDATVTQFQDYQGAAADLSASLEEAAKRSADRKLDLEALLQRQIDAMDGPEGEIQKTRDAIDETTKTIGEDLAQVVKGASGIGGGVTTFLTDKLKLVTGILTTFGGSKEKDGSKENGEGAEKAPEKPFTMESIDMEQTGTTGSGDASSGSADLGTAVGAFRAHNAELAKLFQRLARQDASVAVAAAIADQVDSFARSVSDVAAAAGAVAATWQRVADAISALGENDPAGLPRDLAKAATRWTALSGELTYARAAITGKRGAIPDIGTLPRAGVQ
jgi:hypothetical protein